LSASSEKVYEAIGPVLKQLGMAASPDDAGRALRGLQTLAVRLERLETSTLEVARWLANKPEIEAVFHPALPSCPGHHVWKRDFTGSASVFSILFDSKINGGQVQVFADSLNLFKIGGSFTCALPCP